MNKKTKRKAFEVQINNDKLKRIKEVAALARTALVDHGEIRVVK